MCACHEAIVMLRIKLGTGTKHLPPTKIYHVSAFVIMPEVVNATTTLDLAQ